MIDLSNEATLSLPEAAKLIPVGRQGRPLNISTLLRWILSGAKAPDGEVVRLDAIRLGSRWITSKEALARFSERLTPRMNAETQPKPRTPTQRQHASRRAARALEKAGIN